ncbi:ricin-type beta-trefoil lectin domain protein [Streptomyces sp. NPDC088816]|uniref:ricin-type beta-trefoil lectin domain protein n=1 Tax=Streptomyces sp. NPDC088816 TaxID=3365906 RepID=UPI00381A3C92
MSNSPTSPVPFGTTDEQLSAELRKWTGTSPALLPVGELLDRHWEAAFAYARLCTDGSHPAGMLTTAAFTRLFGQSLRQSGPTAAWRPQLLVTVRRIAGEWSTDHRREMLHPELRAAGAEGDRIAARLLPPGDRRLLSRAFQRLPQTARALLWHAEVEAEPLAAPARLLGLDEEDACLELERARERLREECLQVHREIAPQQECLLYLRLLDVTYRRGGAHVDPDLRTHLAGCTHCRHTADQLAQFNGDLGAALAEGVLGWGASTYRAHRLTVPPAPTEPAPEPPRPAPTGGEPFTPSAAPNPPGPRAAGGAGRSGGLPTTPPVPESASAGGAFSASGPSGPVAGGDEYEGRRSGGAGQGGGLASGPSGPAAGGDEHPGRRSGGAGRDGGLRATSAAPGGARVPEAGAGVPAEGELFAPEEPFGRSEAGQAQPPTHGAPRAAPPHLVPEASDAVPFVAPFSAEPWGSGPPTVTPGGGPGGEPAPAEHGGTAAGPRGGTAGRGRVARKAARRVARQRNVAIAVATVSGLVVLPFALWAVLGSGNGAPEHAAGQKPTEPPGTGASASGPTWTGAGTAARGTLRGRLHNAASGLCVGAVGGKAVEGAETELTACSSAPGQQWVYETDGLLRSGAAPALCLDSHLGYSVRLVPCVDVSRPGGRNIRYDFTLQGTLVPRFDQDLALTPAATDGGGALVLKTRVKNDTQRWAMDTTMPELQMEVVNWDLAGGSSAGPSAPEPGPSDSAGQGTPAGGASRTAPPPPAAVTDPPAVDDCSSHGHACSWNGRDGHHRHGGGR